MFCNSGKASKYSVFSAHFPLGFSGWQIITFLPFSIKDGFDKMMDFLRVTEQLEGGKMVIPGEKMTLTTIHSAKGREWKDVIMFACDNVSQPSFDGIHNMIEDGISVHDIFENLDEERRLFYVGNTRAKENLLRENVKRRI